MHNPKKITLIGIIIVTVASLFYCYEYFLRVSPAVMQPQLMHTFGIDATSFGALSAAYFIAYTPMQLVVGLMIDRFKVRSVIVTAIVACTAGSFLMASTHIYSVAWAGRFLQGFGSAFAFVSALKLASIWLPGRWFAFFAGLSASLGFLGAAAGEVLMNYLVQTAGWRHTIQVFALFGLLLAICAWFLLSAKPKSHPTPKVHAMPFKLLIRQLLQIMKLRRVWLGGIIAFLVFMPTSVFAALWGIPYLEKLHHYSPDLATEATSFIFIGWAIGSPLMGYLSDIIRNRINVIRIGTLMAFLLSLVLLYDRHLSFWLVCILFTFFGIVSAVQALCFVIARDLSPSPQSIGTAVAFVNMLTMLGGMIFQRGVGHIIDWAWQEHKIHAVIHGMRVYSLADYQTAIAIVPIALAIAHIISWFSRDSLPNQNQAISYGKITLN